MNSDPKFAQSADVVADQAVFLMAGKGRDLAVAVWLSGAEDFVNQLQDGASHSQKRGVLLAARFGGDAPELLLQETIFLGRGRPGAFGQGAAQPAITSCRAVASILPSAPIVSGADARPGTEVPLRRELRHVRSGLGEDLRGAALLHSRHGLQDLPLSIQARLLNLGGDISIDLLDLFFDKLHVR